MKKKICSIVLTVAMLISMLSLFSLSAGALMEWDHISPGDAIILPGYTYYYEVILTGFTRGTDYYIPLTPNNSGHLLIQSFGPGGVYAPAITVLSSDGTEIVREATNGFKTQGYHGNQTLVQLNASGSYILKINPKTSSDMRLSFTFAENHFDVSPLISTFSDITEMENGVLSGYWTPGTHAFVGRFTAEDNGETPIATFGCSYMEAYLLDPGTNTVYALCSFAGETTQNIPLTKGVEYYVVMFIPDGILDVPPCMLYFIIG